MTYADLTIPEFLQRNKGVNMQAKTTQSTLQTYLDRFKISQIEFALAIGVNTRTVRRWNDNLPNPILRLLEAWGKLDDCGLSFLPNSMDLDLSMSGVNLLTRKEIKSRVRPLWTNQ